MSEGGTRNRQRSAVPGSSTSVFWLDLLIAQGEEKIERQYNA